MLGYALPQPEWSWWSYERMTYAGGYQRRQSWTAWSDTANAYLLGWHAAQPNASVRMFNYSQEYGWQHVRDWSPTDPQPQVYLPQASMLDLPPPPAAPAYIPPTLLTIEQAQVYANRRAVFLGAVFVLLVAGSATVSILRRRGKKGRR